MNSQETREQSLGGPTEKWDAALGQLISERREALSGDLKEIDVELKTGRLVIEQVAESESPSVVVRVTVNAPTEQEAKSLVAKEGKISLRKSNNSLRIEDSSQGSYTNFSGVTIGGNIRVGGLIISGGEVIINGRRITGNEGVRTTVPEREVILRIPTSSNIAYNLRNDSGSISMDRGQGRADLSTISGEIKIGEFTGELRIESRSGNLKVKHCKGEINGRLTSGDLRVGLLEGAINLSATSGNISIQDARISGKTNRIMATSGDVKLGIGNENLKVIVAATSGNIDLDRDEFKVTKESKPKGSTSVTVVSFESNSVVTIKGDSSQSMIEGYYGQDTPDAPELILSVTSGDVEMYHR